MSSSFLLRPLSIVDDLFQRRADQSSATPIHLRPDDDCGISAAFATFLCDPHNFAQVPLLNVTDPSALAERSLVRFRGMVQNMFDPEFYMGVYSQVHPDTGLRKWRCGLYREEVELEQGTEVDSNPDALSTFERQSLYCVPIPGESPWVKEELESKLSQSVSSMSSPSLSSLSEHNLRKRTSDAMFDSSDEAESQLIDRLSSENEPRRMRTADTQETSPASDRQTGIPDLNHPLPGTTGMSCIVKIAAQQSPYKLNDVVEFIGIFYRSGPTSEATDEFEDVQNDMAFSLVPRLHVLVHHPLTDANPILPMANSPEEQIMFTALKPRIETIRQIIHAKLTELLMGDALAAEYLLMTLLSRVYARKDTLSLGKLSINISGCDPTWDIARALHGFISQTCPRTHLLHLTVDNLNKTIFTPYKDYEKNHLVSGLLQLSAGTIFLVNECALQPGQLNEKGVAHFKALQEISLWQKTEYNFHFHQMQMPTDFPFVSVSEAKSLIQTDVHVPLSPASALGAAGNEIPWADLRAYLGLLRRMDFRLEHSIAQVAEEDYVRARQQDSSLGQQDFHVWLTLARLQSISHGEEALSQERWSWIRHLEAERIQRIRKTQNTA